MKALNDVAAEEVEEETFELPETEAATTSLGSLFKTLSFDVTMKDAYELFRTLYSNNSVMY